MSGASGSPSGASSMEAKQGTAATRRDTKILLKQGNEVRTRPHSASRVNSSSSSSSNASRVSASGSSSSSSSSSSSNASSPSSSRLRRVPSTSAPNTTSPGSSSTPSTSTSRTSSHSTSCTTSSSSNCSTSSSSVSSASSSSSSTPKAGGQLQLQRRQHDPLSPQQLREWYARRGGGGGSSGDRCAAIQLGASGGGLAQPQRSPRETLTSQQLREWYVQRGTSRSSARCPYVIRTGDWAGQTCGTVGHTQSRCLSCLSDTWHAEFGDAAELPLWLELIRQGVDVFSLDYDIIFTAMYALTIGAEGDCSLSLPPDPSIAAAALGASESSLPGTAPAEALHTFTLDSGASRSFFRDSTTLTPLPAPVPIRQVDPSGGPVIARFSTVLPCPACSCPPGFDGHYHHSWGSACVDLHVYTDRYSSGHVHSSATVGSVHNGYQASSGSCVCSGVRVRSGTTPLLVSPPFTPGSSVAPPPGSPLPATPSWHALPSLVSGLPRSLPPLPPSPAPPCLPCIEGRQPAAPHSSSFPSTTAPLQTLHMDVWGPARINGQGHKRYFLLVVDDYTRYTTVFPLRSKGQVIDVFIPWIRAVRLQLRERFRQDLPYENNKQE
ncbi:unnamed protein product [Closterium sp. NIES-54]